MKTNAKAKTGFVAALLAVALAGAAASGCTSSFSKGALLNMKIAYGGNVTGTYTLYVTSTNSSATPSTGWAAKGIYTKSQFSVAVSYDTGLKNTGTSYAHAYWSKSGAASGPQAGDPYGYGAFKKGSFSDAVDVDVTLQ